MNSLRKCPCCGAESFVATSDNRGPAMITASGRWFWPLDPRREDVAVIDVAHHLGMECRWAGAVRRFYSVAEHSVLVSQFVDPAYALEALLHDAAEAYCKDLHRPIKHGPGCEGYRKILDRVQDVILARFGIKPTSASTAEIKSIDDALLVDESLALIPLPGQVPGTPLGAVIRGWDPHSAKYRFLERFAQLVPHGVS